MRVSEAGAGVAPHIRGIENLMELVNFERVRERVQAHAQFW